MTSVVAIFTTAAQELMMHVYYCQLWWATEAVSQNDNSNSNERPRRNARTQFDLALHPIPHPFRILPGVFTARYSAALSSRRFSRAFCFHPRNCQRMSGSGPAVRVFLFHSLFISKASESSIWWWLLRLHICYTLWFCLKKKKRKEKEK